MKETLSLRYLGLSSLVKSLSWKGTGIQMNTKSLHNIRQAAIEDVSRIAEILVFTKRMNYRSIFHDDLVSFGEIQVLPLALDYLSNKKKLESIWVYDDAFVKGMICLEDNLIQELYVDSFFQNQGIGASLIHFALQEHNVRYLWVLEKNVKAIRFYQSHGFVLTKERKQEPGTPEFIAKMEHRSYANIS